MPSLADFHEHYENLTTAEGFAGAFAGEVERAQLSVHDEPTSADMPDPEAARLCTQQMVSDLFALMGDTRLAPLAARIAWGVVNSFHKVAQQVARDEDDAARALGELARIQDPSEIHVLEVEEKQRLCQSLSEALAAIECMRDHAAEVYRVETGKPWSATSGSRTSRALTASQIEARDFLAARAQERREAYAPSGPVVVVSGGSGWQAHEPLWQRLDLIRERVPHMTLLSIVMQEAEAFGYRQHASNPCRGIARYKRKKMERFLSMAEYRALGNVLRGAEGEMPQAVALLRLLIATGARVGEITGLRWEWVKESRIFLPDSKTGAKVLYLNAPARAVLDGLRTENREGLVFPSPHNPTKPIKIASEWQDIRQRAGLGDLRLHDLRHSFASLAIRNGISLTIISRLLGHALPETTERYAHLADDSISEAADRVCSVLAQRLGVAA